MARNQVLISMELYAKTLCSLCLCGELNRYEMFFVDFVLSVAKIPSSGPTT
jgi:hypothetical protein